MNSRDAKDAQGALPPTDESPTPQTEEETSRGAADTRAFLTQAFPTLGGRLLQEAHALMSRRLPVFSWLQPLETVIEHLTSLPVPSQERFQRTEALSYPASFPTQANSDLRDASRTLQPGRSNWTDSSLFSSFLAQTSADTTGRPLRGSTQTPQPGRPTIQAEPSPFSDLPAPASPDLQGFIQTPQPGRPTIQAEPSPFPGPPAPTSPDWPQRDASLFSEAEMSARWQDQTLSAGQPLSPSLQQQVQRFVGAGTETMRIHDDAASDTLAQAWQADAVTSGSHVFFRQGRFRPQEDEGFALLTHEALHVTRAMQPGAAWRRATQAGIQEEEQEAMALESQVLAARQKIIRGDQAAPSGRPDSAQFGWPALPSRQATLPAAPGLAAAQQPMRASSDRTLANGDRAQLTPTTSDIEELRRTLYRDLMRQIKAERERGG